MPRPPARRPGCQPALAGFLVQASRWREVNMACMLSAPGRADTLRGWTACCLSCSPDTRHMHTKRGTYTSPRMRVQRVLTPAKESAEKGMFLGEKAGGRGRAEGGKQQTGWPAAQTITKMGSEIFKDAVAAPSAELWPGCILLPGHAWSPGAPRPSEKG